MFSPTLEIDASWDVVRNIKPKKGEATFHLDSELSVDKIEQILDFQETLPDKDRHKVLIVCDDCADLLKDNKTLSRLFFRGRHARVWCWLSVQSFRAVPRNIRLNSGSLASLGGRLKQVEFSTQTVWHHRRMFGVPWGSTEAGRILNADGLAPPPDILNLDAWLIALLQEIRTRIPLQSWTPSLTNWLALNQDQREYVLNG